MTKSDFTNLSDRFYIVQIMVIKQIFVLTHSKERSWSTMNYFLYD